MRKDGLVPHIVIIGAGIPGVTSAYALNKRGYDVTVIEGERHPATTDQPGALPGLPRRASASTSSRR
jgi:glycine/D-amino acid oxidase-like deaminating enzyme